VKRADRDELILKHYREQAEECGDSPLSTMGEGVVRQKEVDFITSFIRAVSRRLQAAQMHVLDAGCGNGYTLQKLTEALKDCHFYGLEMTPELLQIATSRQLNRCQLQEGNIRRAPYDDRVFDIIFTERCLVNILDKKEQLEALREIARMLKPTGYYLMIECFNDGLENNNRARREMGLDDIAPAYHNLYFDKEELHAGICEILIPVDPEDIDQDSGIALFPGNFLSSHYFVARVLHPLLTKGEWVRNTEFVKFFSFLPPFGNYSPVQSLIFKRNIFQKKDGSILNPG
jgi:SAM-dependent methyltransferase